MKKMTTDNIKNQSDFLRYYNDKNREQFNEELFHRSDDDIIFELKKVILSCQRSRYFTILVDKFSVVEDYEVIQQMLKEQENFKSRNRNKNRSKEDDQYDCIPLKDSKIKLLVVDYYLEVPNPRDEKQRSKNLRVLIKVPKIVNKYYIKIYGNEYSSISQIVDGSTYNNSQSANAKFQLVSFKTLFMASRFYRYNVQLKTTKDEVKPMVYFYSNIFKKGIPLMEYLLAKFGYYGAFSMLHVLQFNLSYDDPDDDEMYTFKSHNIYMSVPKYMFDNDLVTQSLLYTIYMDISSTTTIDKICTTEYWLVVLGSSYSNATVEKGYNILDSLEAIYDLDTREELQLPDEHKQDIYDILIWICREFSSLRRKDNLDISIKRIRWAPYFAAIYSLKIILGLYRISDHSNNIQLIDLERSIYTFPDYLIKKITKDRLVNYKNSVNDIDAFQALKYTFKGISGLGENNSSVPTLYRQVHPTHLSRLDLDSSTANDPGLSGLFCPLSNIHNNRFTDYKEPDTWREDIAEVQREYAELCNLKQVMKLKKDIGINVRDREGIIDESIELIKKLMEPVEIIDSL